MTSRQKRFGCSPSVLALPSPPVYPAGMADDAFRDGLRRHHAELQARFRTEARGTPAYWALEKAIYATDRLHLTLYRSPIQRVHEAGPRTNHP